MVTVAGKRQHPAMQGRAAVAGVTLYAGAGVSGVGVGAKGA